MEYKISIYEVDAKDEYRFALGHMTDNTLFVFGVNPSTANDKEPDQTIKSVMRLCEYHNYKSFVMLNLYPFRSSRPDQLPIEADKNIIDMNIQKIKKIISTQKCPNVLLAWGNAITKRDYLWESAKLIYISLNYCDIKWLRIGELTCEGNPRHPLYIPSSQSLELMDVKSYLEI